MCVEFHLPIVFPPAVVVVRLVQLPNIVTTGHTSTQNFSQIVKRNDGSGWVRRDGHTAPDEPIGDFKTDAVHGEEKWMAVTWHTFYKKRFDILARRNVKAPPSKCSAFRRSTTRGAGDAGSHRTGDHAQISSGRVYSSICGPFAVEVAVVKRTVSRSHFVFH